MQITVDGVDLFALTDAQKQVIQNDIPSDRFDAEMKRRLQWVLMECYTQSFKTLKNEWDDKLAANGVTMVPTDPDAYAKLVFEQPNYKDRSARIAAEGITP